MLSPKRNRELVLARNMSYYILHTAYQQKAAQIAPHFKRDRTTILHGIHTFVNDIEVIPFYMEKYDAVMDQLFKIENIFVPPKLATENPVVAARLSVVWMITFDLVKTA